MIVVSKMIEIKKKYEVTDGLKLILSNVNGHIRIKDYGDTIKIKAEKSESCLHRAKKSKLSPENRGYV